MDRSQWDRLAKTFEEEVCDIAGEETADRLAPLVRLAAPQGKDAVLVELGCGLGSFLLKFQSHFSRMIAVDFAPKVLARAKKRCSRLRQVEWLCSDVTKAHRVIGTRADLTVCNNVITSPDQAERNAILRTIARITKKNGYALIVVPSLESERMVRALTGGSKDRTPIKGGLVLRDDAVQKQYLRGEFAAALLQHGLEPVRIRRVYYPWWREGVRKPRKALNKKPWDWAFLAARVAAR
jgi:ubiquinone/menaquinone biosynthesis C-methylase UbiE